jgi:hypothetical protein
LNAVKRIAALGLGAVLLWETVRWHATWLALGLLIGCWLGAFATILYLARREGESFGGWRDWTIVGCIGTAVATLIILLVLKASLPTALFQAISRGIGGGAAFGGLSYGLGSRSVADPVEVSATRDANTQPSG